MIKEFKLIRIDCDGCGKFYPSTKEPIHFQDKEAANETVFENGWTIIGERHICHACAKEFQEADENGNLYEFYNSKFGK